MHSKGTINTTKTQPTEWEKILTNDISDKGFVFKKYKELNSKPKKTPNNPIKNGQKTGTDISPKKTYRWLLDT